MAPPTTQQAFAIALQHHREGRLQEAEQLYRQVLARDPAHAEALHFLGVMANQAGRNDVAVELIRRAIALRPDFADSHYNLGVALADNGQLGEAIAAWRQAISLRPGFPEAHTNLGNALRDTGQLDEAIVAFRQAIALNDELPEVHNNLGNALKDKGELDQAIVECRRAIALRPTYAEAYSNLGVAFNARGQLEEAIAACRQATVLNPVFAKAWCNLGAALGDKGQLDEAIAAWRQAIDLDPNYAEAHNNLGATLGYAGQLDEGIAACRKAIALRPDYAEAHSNLIFALQRHPGYDARKIAEELGRWNRQHAEPLRKWVPAPLTYPNDRAPERRLRIGYVSPDFLDHVVGRNLLPLFRRHDRNQFDITCYSQSAGADAITREFQTHADRWRRIIGLSDDQVIKQIREDRIDVLVDLALHTAHNRLLVFARKPAPVQATFAGYPGSTGLNTIDYRLSDPYLDPPGMDESIYSEKTIRLPDSFWCYDPLENGDIPVNPLPALQNGVVTFGCLNNFCKLNDSVLTLWARVLRQVEGSRLLLLAPPGSHRQRTLDRLRLQGIDPGRIQFAPQQSRRAYLQLYHRIDLGLDSFPYNGHTTSLDSFWMGVPVVTLVGQTAVSRAGWCQASNLGLADLAAETPEQFVRKAAELATNLPRLKELRAGLRRRMELSPLMDAAKFARSIENAYRQIWRRWCHIIL